MAPKNLKQVVSVKEKLCSLVISEEQVKWYSDLLSSRLTILVGIVRNFFGVPAAEWGKHYLTLWGLAFRNFSCQMDGAFFGIFEDP